MTDAHCDLTDLPVAFCAHCLGHHLDEDLADDEIDDRPWFKSEWPGACATCHAQFPADTLIRHHAHGWQADCCRRK